MNRRAFLKLAGWAGAAYVALPVDGFDSLIYQPAVPTISGVEPLQVVDFVTATKRVALAMAKHLPYAVQSIADPIAGHVHFGIDGSKDSFVLPVFTPGREVDASVFDLYGTRLAERAAKEQINTFSSLQLPSGVYAAANVRLTHGPTVRGIMAYDIIGDRMLMRFDVQGGRA